MLRIFSFITVLFFMFSCSENQNAAKLPLQPPPPPGIFKRSLDEFTLTQKQLVVGLYFTEKYNFSGAGLALFPDGRYEYSAGSCLTSSIDSGDYNLRSDSIYFFSNFTKIEKSSSSGHNTIMDLPPALIVNNVLYFGIDSHIMKLYKKGFYHFDVLSLDKFGNGQSFKLDTNCIRIEEGQYRKFNLYNGIRFKYKNAEERFPSGIFKIKGGKEFHSDSDENLLY